MTARNATEQFQREKKERAAALEVIAQQVRNATIEEGKAAALHTQNMTLRAQELARVEARRVDVSARARPAPGAT
jgi:DNA-binding protein H-NS